MGLTLRQLVVGLKASVVVELTGTTSILHHYKESILFYLYR